MDLIDSEEQELEWKVTAAGWDLIEARRELFQVYAQIPFEPARDAFKKLELALLKVRMADLVLRAAKEDLREFEEEYGTFVRDLITHDRRLRRGTSRKVELRRWKRINALDAEVERLREKEEDALASFNEATEAGDYEAAEAWKEEAEYLRIQGIKAGELLHEELYPNLRPNTVRPNTEMPDPVAHGAVGLLPSGN